MIWFVCIILFSAVDGSQIAEFHGKVPMTLEECNEAIFGKSEPVKDGVATLYQCHKEEGIES